MVGGYIVNRREEEKRKRQRKEKEKKGEIKGLAPNK
jgi:hypothetical protein